MFVAIRIDRYLAGEMPRVVHAVDVEIKGELDPSLAKAVNLTESQLKRLQSAQKVFNDLMGKTMTNMPKEAIQASNQINSALTKIGAKSKQPFL